MEPLSYASISRRSDFISISCWYILGSHSILFSDSLFRIDYEKDGGQVICLQLYIFGILDWKGIDVKANVILKLLHSMEIVRSVI